MFDFDRRDFMKTAAGAGALLAQAQLSRAQPAAKPSQKSVSGLTLEPMKTVRIGFIGVGGRLTGHLKRMLKIEGVEVNAVCDIDVGNAKRAAGICKKAGRPEPSMYTKGDFAYRELVKRDDLDLIMIGTPWRWHAVMCVDSMRAGKHCMVEVPAAVTVQECWDLVDAAEQTQKNCMMLENVCYGREELMVLNMCAQGAFGTLLHGEAAYIHDLRGQMRNPNRGIGMWRPQHHTRRDGNLYPTHGLGPVCQYMNINRGDKLNYQVSMSSPAVGRDEYCAKLADDHPYRNLKQKCGDMNTSLIKTALGRSIMLQHDTTSPRPYSRINLIQGTQGCFRGFPDRVAISKWGNGHKWQDMDKCYKEFDHPLWKRMGAEAVKGGGHGGMDFLLNWRSIYCLRNGIPLDQDVYDAAAWSVVGPISELSVAQGSAPIPIPDFTRGKWKTNKPLGVVS